MNDLIHIRLPRFATVGFVGARRLGPNPGRDGPREEQLRSCLCGILDRLERELPAGTTLSAVSAVAVGADTVFAEVCASRGILHQIYLPQAPDSFFKESDFFDSADLVARSKALLGGENVVEVRVVSDSTERRTRFSDCGYCILHDCDILIAVVSVPDQSQPPRPGGSEETLQSASSAGCRIIKVILDETLSIDETAARSPPLHPPSGVFEWELGQAKAIPGVAPAVAALKETASRRAARHKAMFNRGALLVFGAHLMATSVAVLVLMHAPHEHVLKWVKVGLLASGVGIYWGLHHRRPQREWVTARLVAELSRSVIALRGLPGYLGYLREFHLPGCHDLVRSLNLLHLRSARAFSEKPEAFAARYLRDRLDGQINHFSSQSRVAERLRVVLEGSFYGLSLIAIAAAISGALLRTALEPEAWLKNLFVEFVPVVFPVTAALAASLVAVLDLDRRVETYDVMRHFLKCQRPAIIGARYSQALLTRVVHRTEHALLQEVVEWYAKHIYLRGG